MAYKRPSRGQTVKDYSKLHDRGFSSEENTIMDYPKEGEQDASWEKAKGSTSGVEFMEEKDRLEKRLLALEEEERLEQLRQKIKEKEDSLVALRSGSIAAKSTPKAKGNGFNVTDLRKQTGLLSRARSELKKLGFENSSSSEEEQESSDQESDNRSDKQRRHKSKRKSGIKSKASDSVVDPQKYPHAYLRFEFVNNSLEFDDLDLNMFVAGELEIISQKSTPPKEMSARLELLKRLMYLNRAFDFSVLKSLYAAILREVELGYRKWGEDFHYIETAVLASSNSIKSKPKSSYSEGFRPKSDFSKGSTSPKSDERSWFCSKFQRNRCEFKESHVLNVKGKMRLAKHICAFCWQKDKKELKHPECSSACPNTTS